MTEFEGQDKSGEFGSDNFKDAANLATSNGKESPFDNKEHDEKKVMR